MAARAELRVVVPVVGVWLGMAEEGVTRAAFATRTHIPLRAVLEEPTVGNSFPRALPARERQTRQARVLREGFCSFRRYMGMDYDLSDTELLTRSVEESELFASLYERYGLAVRRYVQRRIGDEFSDDLASEVFVAAFRARARYRPERVVALPWLFGIANNVIAGHRRLERRRLAVLERLARETPGVVEHEHAGLVPELVRLLRALPAAERDTLLLVVWGELTQDEAAAALGVPVGTISSRITRARGRLATALQHEPPALAQNLRGKGEANV